MDADERRTLRRKLKRRGFDLTTSQKCGTVRPKCSQCQAMVIQGLACHETGCPNNKKRR